MKPIYEVTIRVTREEEGLTEREYVKIGVDEHNKNEYAYSDQVNCIKKVDRTLAKLEVKDLNVSELVKAVLEHSS